MSARSTPLILVADDDHAVMNIVESMLKRKGWQVLRAQDGVQCVDLYRQHISEIDLVITDAAMPQLDGFKVIQMIRSINAGIPILLMSGYPKELLEEGDDLSQVSGFLAKPFTMGALYKQIKTLLDSSVNQSGETQQP
ncbi:MAG: response regulator [bacterium]